MENLNLNVKKLKEVDEVNLNILNYLKNLNDQLIELNMNESSFNQPQNQNLKSYLLNQISQHFLSLQQNFLLIDKHLENLLNLFFELNSLNENILTDLSRSFNDYQQLTIEVSSEILYVV